MSAAKEAFYEKYAQAAIEQQIKYGIPASVTLAQMAIESGSGTSIQAIQDHNYFGIKKGGSWNGPVNYYKDDHGYKEPFRVYGSVSESIEDHSRILMYPVYQKRCKNLSSTDYVGWADGIGKVYASNGSYAKMLKEDIQHYHLDKYDRLAVQQAQQQGLQIGYMRGQKGTTPTMSVSSSTQSQLAYLQGNWVLPIDLSKVRVSAVFGENRPGHNHGGIDLSTKGQNLAVFATEDRGKVIAAKPNNGAAGNMVTVEYTRQDGTKMRTTYMHLSQIGVKEGDMVNAGQQIGVSGNSGRSTGAHLHFETQRMDRDGNWKKFDPTVYLAEMEVRGNNPIPLDKGGQDVLAQQRSQMYMSTQQGQQDSNQALLASITNSNDPTKWLAYLMNNNGEMTSGKDMFSELISTMFTAAITLATKLQAEDKDAAQADTLRQNQENTTVKRERETVDAKALQQKASIIFDTDYPEQQQSNGLRQA